METPEACCNAADEREIRAIGDFMVDVQICLHETMDRKNVSRAELARRMGLSTNEFRRMFAHGSDLTIRQFARAPHHLGEEPRVVSELTRALRNERQRRAPDR